MIIFVLLLLSSTVSSESCWVSWTKLPNPRTGANVVRIGTHAYVVGGTSDASYDKCRSRYFAAFEQTVICTPNYELDVFKLNLLAPNPGLAPPLATGIHGRSFAVGIEQTIYLCYACAWSLGGNRSTSLVAIDVPANTLSLRMPMPSPRVGACLVNFGGDTLFVFGGLLDAWPDDHVLIHNISENRWTSLHAGPTTPRNLCDCSSSVGKQQIFLFNCLNCTSQQPISDVFVYNVQQNTWTGRQSIEGFPQIGASSGATLGRFATSIWPNAARSPHVLMYDMVLDTVLNEPVDKMQPRLQHSAYITFGVNVFAFGGNAFNESSGTFGAVSNEVYQVPLLFDLTPNYNTSAPFSQDQDIYFFTNDKCPSPTQELRLSLTPDCRQFIGNSTRCDRRSSTGLVVFPAPKIDIEEGGSRQLWICTTEGTCDVSTSARRPCSRPPPYQDPVPVIQRHCRWNGCCWQNNSCFAAEPLTTQFAKDTAYWYAVNVMNPITVVGPGIAIANSAWYTTKGFKIAVGLAGAIILYIIIICVWRQNAARANSGSSIDSLFASNSSFGAFGKKYQVVKKIGQGGFGTVFHATRRSDGMDVAIKYIPCSDAKARDAAIREFDLSQKVRHPNKMECIDLVVQWSEEDSSDSESVSSMKTTSSSKVKSHSLNSSESSPLIGPANKFVCLVMPYYALGDLRCYTLGFTESGGQLPASKVLSFAAQLCGLVEYLHGLEPPMVHRDLKPENILIADDASRIVVSDFGMANYNTQTYMTTRAGTLHYAAPETWKKQSTPAIDVWSMGCIIYAITTGQISKDDTRVMFNDVDDEDFAESIQHDLSRLGSTAATIVLKMLAKDPKQRITAHAAKAAFDELLAHHPQE